MLTKVFSKSLKHNESFREGTGFHPEGPEPTYERDFVLQNVMLALEVRCESKNVENHCFWVIEFYFTCFGAAQRTAADTGFTTLISRWTIFEYPTGRGLRMVTEPTTFV